MKVTNLNYKILLAALIVLLAISVPTMAAEEADEDGDIQVTIQDLPAAVKATLLQAAGTGTIQELEEEPSGIYSADVINDGVKYDIEIAADGKLLKNEIDKEDDENESEEDEVVVTLDQVPTAVADAIKKEAGSGTIGKIEKETEDGQTIYSAEITRDGKKLEVEVAADGKVLEVEEEDD